MPYNTISFLITAKELKMMRKWGWRKLSMNCTFLRARPDGRKFRVTFLSDNLRRCIYSLTTEIKCAETAREKNLFRPLRDKMRRYYNLREQLLAQT
jgi:hypothetical protein